MSSVTLEKIIKEAQALTPDERQQLLERLSVLPQMPPTDDDLEDAFERELVAEGILSEVKPLATDSSDYYSYKPITVKGKPLSETIIEDRR